MVQMKVIHTESWGEKFENFPQIVRFLNHIFHRLSALSKNHSKKADNLWNTTVLSWRITYEKHYEAKSSPLRLSFLGNFLGSMLAFLNDGPSLIGLAKKYKYLLEELFMTKLLVSENLSYPSSIFAKIVTQISTKKKPRFQVSLDLLTFESCEHLIVQHAFSKKERGRDTQPLFSNQNAKKACP